MMALGGTDHCDGRLGCPINRGRVRARGVQGNSTQQSRIKT